MRDILDLKNIENYKRDLKKQNRKKNGRTFTLSDKIIEIPRIQKSPTHQHSEE